MDSTASPALGNGGVPLAAWEGRAVEELAERWRIPQLWVFDRVTSTNDVAIALARQGAEAGTVVLAEEQTAGRGRGAHGWSSLPALGIWMSVVLRPDHLPAAGALPLLIGLAAARALDAFCAPAIPQIKWPNDLLVAGRKLGGILCEGAWEQERLSFVVAGIGLNVHHQEVNFPHALQGSATSVCIVSGRHAARSEIAGAVLSELHTVMQRPVLGPSALAELHRRDALLGRDIAVTDGSAESVRGVAFGIAEDGALRVRTPSGTERHLRSGTVRFAGGAAAAQPGVTAPSVRP